MKKYGESKAFYTTNQNTADNITNNPKEAKNDNNCSNVRC
jgi:hypothetical protein